MTLTVETLVETLKQVEVTLGSPLPRVIVSHYALEDTDERLFPESRHRSKRIHKKLVKRFGGEFRQQPCVWKTPEAIIMHPAMKRRLKEVLQKRMDVAALPSRL